MITVIHNGDGPIMLLRLLVSAPMAVLDSEEGRLADAFNQGAGMRAWDLWRTQVRAQVNW